jgi:TP901 family phage tail tape measure protein
MDPLKIPIIGIDRFSRIFRSAAKGVGDIGDRISKFQGQFQKAGGLLGLGGGLLTVGTGLSKLPGIALDQEHGIAKIGVASKLSGAELAKLDRQIQATTKSANQFDDDVEGSAAALLKMQFAAEEVHALLPIIGKAATATGVPMLTLARAAGAMRDRMGIAPEKMGAAFDQMVESSKHGKVALEDIAGGITGLASHAGLLGIKGPGAMAQIGAALQITARGADSSSEAVATLQGVFDNLGKDKVTKTLQGLEDLGMIKGGTLQEYFKIIRTSKDPMLDMIKMMDQITGGDAKKLGAFFKGKESVIAMQDLIKNVREYGTLRGNIAAADGVVQKDFNTMMDTTTERWKQFKIQLLTTALPHMEPGLAKLNGLLGFMNSNATAIKATLLTIGGFLGGGALLVALGTVASSVSSIILLATTAAPALAALGTGLAAAALPMAAIAGALTTAFAAVKGISVIMEVWNARNAAKDRRANLEAQLTGMGKSPEQVAALMEKFDSSLAGKAATGPKMGPPLRTPGDLSKALAGAHGAAKNQAEISVKFEGAPAGTRVETKASKGVKLGTELGLAF